MKNKQVLITGASKGIGLAASFYLANTMGWQVVGVARSSPNSIDFPGEFLACDLSDKKQTAELAKKLVTQYNIDAIVNNVGIALPESLDELSLSNLLKVYDINVRVAAQLTQALIPNMKLRRWGRVVNISSRAIFGVKNRTSYAAAKSAIVGCTKTWALELAEYNICVNAIAPGPIETELFRKSRPVGSEAERAAIDNVPLNRIGQPNEIAATVAFLLSDLAGFITGQVLCVDGGASL